MFDHNLSEAIVECCHTLVLLFGSHEDDEDDFELENVGWYIFYFFVSI